MIDISGNPKLDILPWDIFDGISTVEILRLYETGLTCLPKVPPGTRIWSHKSFPLCPVAVSITGGSAVTEGGDVVFTLTANPAPAANLPVTVNVSETGSFATSGETGTRTVTVGASGTVDFTVATEDIDCSHGHCRDGLYGGQWQHCQCDGGG